MAAIQSLKKQLRGIRSTQKLTKAMKTISTVKFSKLNGLYSDYAAYGKQCEQMYRQFGSAFLEALGNAKEDAPEAVVVLAGNKGLCGSFNAEVLQYAKGYLEEHPSCCLVVCGKKAIQYFKGKNIAIEKEVVFEDVPSFEGASHLLDTLLSLRKEGKIGAVSVIYPHYRNMMFQQPMVKELFGKGVQGEEADFLFVPDSATIIERTARNLFHAMFYELVLETAVGAQAATLMTMRAAYDTATDYCTQLEGQINRLRQSAVTADVIETSAEREEIF